MLISLIVIMLLGGGSVTVWDFSPVKKEIKSLIANTEERKVALKTLKSAEKRTKTQNRYMKKSAKRLSKILSDPELDIEELEAVWTEYHNTTMKYHRDMGDIRFTLKENINREDWAVIFSH